MQFPLLKTTKKKKRYRVFHHFLIIDRLNSNKFYEKCLILVLMSRLTAVTLKLNKIKQTLGRVLLSPTFFL